MAEDVRLGIELVEMRRIDVARHGGEQPDVVGAHEAHQRGGLADLDLLEGAVDERLVGRVHGCIT